LSAAIFRNAILDESGFEGAQGDGINFINAQLKGSRLSAGIFSNSDFTGANMREVVARAAHFPQSKFLDADLSFTKFSSGALPGADLSGCYCVSANFTNADLRDAVMMGSDLSGVRFERTKLMGVDFTNADVRLSDFRGANLSGANLHAAINLLPEQLSEACGDEETKVPEGFTLNLCSQ